MMSRRDSNLPLLVALVIVLAGHAAAVPWISVLLDPQRTPGRGSPPGLELESMAEREIEIGQDPTRASQVAWIPYDDYRELMAPEPSPTRQPILQREVDPLEHAPLELDPTPPAPAASETPEPAEPTEPTEPTEAGEPDEPAEPLDPDLLVEGPSLAGTIPLPEASPEMPGPFQRPTEPDAAPETTEATDDRDEPTEEATQSPPPEEAARPTAAPRGESESPLADLTAHTHRVQPGRVLTAGNVEIRTVQPRFSAVARSSAVPRNAIVELTFEPDGSVAEVQFQRDTGYSNVDRPLRSSLYRWHAVGDGLEQIDEPFTLTFEIILSSG